MSDVADAFPMIAKRLLVICASALSAFAITSSAEAATPVALSLPQSTAFSILGRSCGGIQEQAYATGFSTTTGDPVGAVHMSTRCGSSGRGGGYKTTTYTAWAYVDWNFAGAVLTATATAAPAVDAAFSASDPHGDRIYNQNGQAFVSAVVAAAPAAVTITPAGGQFQISWTADPTAPPSLITSSVVTATPVASSAAVVTTTVSGAASSALIGPLTPQTTYQLSVLSNDAAGPSAPSDPVTLTTGASATPPGAPGGVAVRWTAPGALNDTLVATWHAGTAGDSPTDSYQITITGTDGGGTYTQTVSGSTLTATFSVSDIPDWQVKVRAHDVAGWGPWSAAVTLGGT